MCSIKFAGLLFLTCVSGKLSRTCAKWAESGVPECLAEHGSPSINAYGPMGPMIMMVLPPDFQPMTQEEFDTMCT